MAAATVMLGSADLTAERPDFGSGFEIFQHEWTYEPPDFPEAEGLEDRDLVRRLRTLPGDGLGPMHNATSCESCHAGGGGAGVDRNVTLLTIDPRSEIFDHQRSERAEVRERFMDLYPGLLAPSGQLSLDVVIHEASTRPSYQAIRDSIANHVPSGLPEGWYQSAKRNPNVLAAAPVLAGRIGDIDFYLSQRNSPPLFGLGLIDRISVSRLAMIAASQSRRSDGKISGRVGAGKFGWRAQTPTLARFVRGACAGELGLHVMRSPQPADVADETYLSLGLDLSENEVQMLVRYVGTLPAPAMLSRDSQQARVLREGRKHFIDVGCNDCHVEHVYPARGIFSDLLLHDMGERLQAPSPSPLASSQFAANRMALPRFPPPDSLRRFRLGFGSVSGYYGSQGLSVPRPYPMVRPATPVFPRGPVPAQVIEAKSADQLTWDALQREWRTPPLWGVADSGPYLHDGRATTLSEAISWHGGEASEVIERYQKLTQPQRDTVITFLKSLRAPGQDDLEVMEPTEDIAATLASRSELGKLQTMARSVNVFE